MNLDGGPEQEGEPFNFDAVPSRFFYDVETVGGMGPDEIVTRGISTLQHKLAEMIDHLNGREAGEGMDFGGAQSPQMNGGYGGPEYGSTTPYGGGPGAGSVWAPNAGAPQGGTTPYGTTPYGGPQW